MKIKNRILSRSYLRNKMVYCLLFLLFCGTTVFANPDTYFENFDDYRSGVTINGVQSWVVGTGDTSDAVTQSGVTAAGGGNALELTGTETVVGVSRGAAYGDVSPCWIELVVKPGLGNQAASVPSGKICAVNFDYTGKIYVSDGASWTDTGKTFSSDEWYKVILKINFSTHTYDVYIESLVAPKIEFTAEAQNLAFIDNTINSISEVGFEGAYSTSRADDTFIDDLLVHFVDRLQIITASQTITENQTSTPITVGLQDAYSSPQTAWRDIALELKTSSEKGEFSADKDAWISVNQIVIPEGAQSVAFYYKDSKVGKPMINVKEYPDRGWEEALQQEEVIAQSTYFDVSINTPQVAGEYFSLVITAKDETGQTDEFYGGEIELFLNYITPGIGTMGIIPGNASGFKNGVLELNMMYADCGVIEIVVRDTDEPSDTGTSGEVVFMPASFTVSAVSPQVVNKPFTLTVSSLNAFGQGTPNYYGTASVKAVLVSPEGAAVGTITPTSLGAADFTAGIASVSASYNYWGNIKVEVYDAAHPIKSGASGQIQFNPAELLLEVKAPSATRDFFYVGETIEISVSALDTLEVVIPNYLGNIDVSSTTGMGLPSKYQFVASDTGKHIFAVSVDSGGTYSVYAEDRDSGLKSDRVKFEVKEVILEVVSTVSPVGTTEIIIRLVDEDGNLISGESSLDTLISLSEENDDSSASSSATSVPVTFQNGIAKILISNSEAEVVTISPSSKYDFKIKTGTVTFGRFTKTGIGTLMWREIKD